MGAPRPDTALDALGEVHDAVLAVVTAIDAGRVRDLSAARDRIEAVREDAAKVYDRHLTLERRLALTTEAATLRKAAADIRDLSPAAAGRLIAQAADVEARLGHVPPHLVAPFQRALGRPVALRLTDADALRIAMAVRDDADIPEDGLMWLETAYPCVADLFDRECAPGAEEMG